MKNVVLTGVGGQGTVLAAKVLAQAAENRGWHVRTAETIGMAQRGGSVVSHVRMGDAGERVASPLVPRAQADLLVAFELNEAARMMPILKPEGVLVTATNRVQPVSAQLAKAAETGNVREAVRERTGRTVEVPDEALLREIGNPRALNMVLLTCAIATGVLDVSLDEFKSAVAACVKPRFVAMNLAAIDLANDWAEKQGVRR